MIQSLPFQFWQGFGIVLIVINLLAFSLMGVDKRRARRQRWRIPESTLFLPALLGGGVGAYLGMKLFHHKTKHWYFRLGFPLLALIQIALVLFLLAQYR